jgi:hypothetical protein
MSRASQSARNHRSAWTLEEIRYLERHYGHMPAKDIADRLGRTAVAVRLAARNAGIGKVGHSRPWTDDEKEVIRTHYANGEGIRRVCELLAGRNRSAIFAMAIKMGIGSPRKWSDDEVAVLERHYQNIGVKVAHYLPGRTKDAVKLKAGSLKLKYQGGTENGAHQRIWSDREWQLLTRHQHLTLPEVMQFFPNRSRHSVKKARERLRKSLSLK